jgi:hypothetical protein
MKGSGRPIPAPRIISLCGFGLTAAVALCAPALGAGAAADDGGVQAALGPMATRVAFGSATPVAAAARTARLTEKARLRFVSEHGSTLVERGYAYGTYNAPIVADLTIHAKSVAAQVTIYPRGGTISGSADANYKIVKNLGYFGGSFNLGHGTGRYSHVAEARRKPLGISGVINRENFEVEVKASGEVTGL